MSTALIHGTLITPEDVIKDGAVIWSGETIEHVGRTSDLSALLKKCDVRLDVNGRYISPGFIELHMHGAMGCDMADADPAAIHTIREFLLQRGTTACLGALCYDPAAMRVFRDAMRRDARRSSAGEPDGPAGGQPGAELLGMYLEGPFVNPARRGGIPESAVQPPSLDHLQSLLSEFRDALRVMVLAPEIPGVRELIPYVLEAGVLPAQGHSDAPLDTAREAAALGATHLTHLFNAMSGLHHRDPGLATLMFDRTEAEEITGEIIADGVHVHPALLRMVIGEPSARRRVALITDSVRPTGMPDGDYTHLGRPMTLDGNRAALLDGTLVGSVMTLDRAVANVVRYCDLPIEQAVEMATLTPARILGLAHERGKLAYGYRADMVVFNDRMDVQAVYQAGRPVRQTSLA